MARHCCLFFFCSSRKHVHIRIFEITGLKTNKKSHIRTNVQNEYGYHFNAFTANNVDHPNNDAITDADIVARGAHRMMALM